MIKNSFLINLPSTSHFSLSSRNKFKVDEIYFHYIDEVYFLKYKSTKNPIDCDWQNYKQVRNKTSSKVLKLKEN